MKPHHHTAFAWFANAIANASAALYAADAHMTAGAVFMGTLAVGSFGLAVAWLRDEG